MSEKKKVLIVEDEKPMAKALKLKFEHTGLFEAKVTFNGQEALDILAQEKFDIILTDLMMPKVDGFTVLKELKNKGIKTPVVVLSNLSQEEDEEKSRQEGAVDFFVKSNVPISEIVVKVKQILKM